MKRLLLLLIVSPFLIFACTPAISSKVATPFATLAPTKTPTPKPTLTPTPTPVWITLGSPFAADCGDGIPRIWSNDSFNGPALNVPSDDHHGHVDIFVPSGCNIDKYKGEVIAPISGTLIDCSIEGHPYVYCLYPDTFYISGIVDALNFAGINNPKINLISEVRLNIGHFNSFIEGMKNGAHVEIGQSIGDVVWVRNHQKIAYQIYVIYNGTDYALSPTLFFQESEWICVPNSPYDCIAESHDYIE
jgi:hypothetical protein